MRTLLASTVLLLLAVTACSKKEIEPARTIEGTYQAQEYGMSTPILTYPINGKDITLEIKYVARDTVSVAITPRSVNASMPAGVYSPVQRLFYPKAHIEKRSDAYVVYLVPTANKDAMENVVMLFERTEWADYVYTPPQTPSISTKVRFEKK